LEGALERGALINKTTLKGECLLTMGTYWKKGIKWVNIDKFFIISIVAIVINTTIISINTMVKGFIRELKHRHLWAMVSNRKLNAIRHILTP